MNGEFCYRDFMCDPPKIPDPPAVVAKPNNTMTKTGTTVSPLASVFASIEESGATTTTVSPLASVFASIQESGSSGGGGNGSNPKAPPGGGDSRSNQNNPTTEQSPQQQWTMQQQQQVQQISPEDACDICGNSQLDWLQRVTFDDKDVSCGEFGWIFQSQNIAEGSDQCLDLRAQYFGKCCYTKPAIGGCDLCDTGIDDGAWHDVRDGVNVVVDGDETSCADFSSKLRTTFDTMDSQCMGSKTKHFDDCW